MKLLINTTTLIGTGVTQVAVSFINELKKISDNTYIIFLSETVQKELNLRDFPKNFEFYSFSGYPQKLMKSFFLRKKLSALEKQINPDIVFSIFGPSYWSPIKPHLQGYAFPHYVYPESPFFKKINFYNRITYFLYKISHRYFLNKNGQYFVSETEDVSKRAEKFLKCKPDNMFTVSNTYNEFYDDYVPLLDNILPEKKKGEFRLLCLCSFAPHKNLSILNSVIPLLKKMSKTTFKFVLTVDEQLFKDRLSDEVKGSIVNLGRVDVNICPQLYVETDALFLPTLLECFTANYPEAMKMKRPILTSELSFATAVCGDAAMYFDPMDANDIALKIIKLVDSEEAKSKLIENGIKKLATFGTPNVRANSYVNICKQIIKKNN